LNKHRIGALIAAMALTLTFASTALASTFTWGHQGFPNDTCTGSQTSMLWVWAGGGTPTGLTINGEQQTGTWSQNGNGGWHFEVAISGTNFPPTSASVEFTGTEGVLTLSHCDGTVTTTTSESTTTSNETTTSDETTTTTETTVSINTQCVNCSTTTSDTTTSEETTPGGSVEELTPPSTDTIGAPTSGSTVSTSLLLVLAGILATALVAIPAAARKRR
jgi:hypothetical protein